jgi:lipoprotein-releasing system ATP-binding protein
MNDHDPSLTATEEPVLVCRDLQRSFADAGNRLEVLRGVNLTIDPGERIAIVGESGAGKTTLLQLMGGLDLPTEGQVLIRGRDIAKLNGTRRGLLRNRELGFVYQFHHLLPEFSALENVAMPLLMRSTPVNEVRSSAEQLLQRVGLGERLHHRPGEMSGGERQRAAVARALITRPALVLADEPTGNLDHANGERLFELMLELNREFGSSLVIVTHDQTLAGRMDRILHLQDGVLKN